MNYKDYEKLRKEIESNFDIIINNQQRFVSEEIELLNDWLQTEINRIKQQYPNPHDWDCKTYMQFKSKFIDGINSIVNRARNRMNDDLDAFISNIFKDKHEIKHDPFKLVAIREKFQRAIDLRLVNVLYQQIDGGAA